MIYKSGLIGIAAIVAVGFASPAFAQRLGVTMYDSGAEAFDMVPGYGGGAYSFAPPANGGGSFGYNQNLRRDEW